MLCWCGICYNHKSKLVFYQSGQTDQAAFFVKRLSSNAQPSWILSGTTRVSRHQKGKTNLDLLEQETVSGSDICWAICKSSPWLRHINMPASLTPLSVLQARCPSCCGPADGRTMLCLDICSNSLHLCTQYMLWRLRKSVVHKSHHKSQTFENVVCVFYYDRHQKSAECLYDDNEPDHSVVAEEETTLLYLNN